MVIVTGVLAVSLFNVLGIIVRQRAPVPAFPTTAIALLSAVVTGVVACSSPSQSQEVSFATADGGTVVADFYTAPGSAP